MDNNNLVNDLSGILDGLDSSQEQLEKDAFDVINSSDTSLNLVKESISSVEEILKMIDELNEIAEESATRIRELEKLSKDIEQFAGVISSISNRTNILSLNASIEAARAGEAGKGFAVVADEIRSLAEMTKSSTEEITQIMNALITLTKNTQNELKHTVDSINIQREKVKTVHESFVAVEQDIDSLVDNMTSVSSEVNAVLDANSSIVDGIETLSGISQEMSSTTETTRQEMHDLNNRITNFSHAIKTTSESLERLRKTSAVDNTEH